jgi:hypothetical protein
MVSFARVEAVVRSGYYRDSIAVINQHPPGCEERM